jgi:hypothetical protein
MKQGHAPRFQKLQSVPTRVRVADPGQAEIHASHRAPVFGASYASDTGSLALTLQVGGLSTTKSPALRECERLLVRGMVRWIVARALRLRSGLRHLACIVPLAAQV